MSDMQVQAELKLKDNLSKPAGTALEALGKSAAKTGTAVDAIGKNQGMQRTAKDAADAARNMSGMARTAQETSRGMDAAALSAKRFRDGAQDAARLIASMRNNMQGVQRTIRDAAGQMQGLGRGAATAMRGAAALGTAGYVAKAALQKPVNLETKSLEAANTIYNELPSDERVKKAKELRASAFENARKYGGSVESAMDMQTRLAAGGLDDATIAKLTPAALKTVVASGAETKDVATLLVKGIKNNMFTAAQAELAMDEAVMGGKKGSFEFASMAKYLPDAAALGTGMKSHKGYQMHIANLQAVETVSANEDAAGNNYKNLLQKLNAKEVRDNFKKKGKIDLTKIELDAAAKGIDPITAMVGAIDGIMGKNKNYQKLKKKLEAAKNNDERREITEQMLDIFQGSKLAQLIPDMQALTALVGILSQKGYRDEVLQSIQNAQGTVESDHSVIASGTEYKEQQVATEKDYAASKTHDATKPYIDAALDFTGRLARENPAAATAAYAGGTAMTAGAAAGTAGALLGGGNAVQGAANGFVFGAKAMAKGSPFLALADAGYRVYQTANDPSLTTAEKNINNMETYGQFGGALSGAAMGAAAGSVLPLIGNVAGAILGGIMGYFAGGKAGKATGVLAQGAMDSVSGEAPSLPDGYMEALQYVQQQASQPISVTIENKLDLDGDRIAEAVTRRLVRESTRH